MNQKIYVYKRAISHRYGCIRRGKAAAQGLAGRAEVDGVELSGLNQLVSLLS